MLTDPGDFVVDPFGGSCVTGEVCERLQRQWACIELSEDYLNGALGRFVSPPAPRAASAPDDDSAHYRLPRPGVLWNGTHGDPLPTDGGQTRVIATEPSSASYPEPDLTADAQPRLFEPATPYDADPPDPDTP